MPSNHVVITGASTGIGAACAVRLAGRGMRVFAGVRKPEDGSAVATHDPERIRPVRLDVTREDSIQQAFEQIAKETGEAGLAGLVNNAGIAVGSPLEFVPMERLRQQFEVNVFGLVRVTQVFLPLLRRGRGRVVNMGSISGRAATPLLGAYAASKHAVEALTDSLRVELTPWDIEVSVIEPGAVATPIWDKGRKAAESMDRFLDPRAKELYGPGLKAIRRAVEDAVRRAVPPQEVARRVEHALTSPRPKTRYLVGKDARLQALLVRWLPDRWRDRLVLRFLNR